MSVTGDLQLLSEAVAPDILPALIGSRQPLSRALCVLIPAMQFTKTFLALAAVFGAVFQLQGCGDSASTETTAAASGNGTNSSNSTRMLADAELLA